MIDNYFTYYTEIEEYFVRKRKKNLLISPLDWCLIEIWKESEIPLHIVFRGIDRSFESAERKGRSNPTTLHYCHPAVIKAFSEYIEAMVGKSEEEYKESAGTSDGPSNQQIFDYLVVLRDELVAANHIAAEPGQIAVKRLSDLEKEISESAGLKPDDVDRELASIAADLVDSLYPGFSEDEQHRFQLDLKDELKIYKKRLSKEMFRRLAEKHRVRKLLAYYDLPEFSLLGVEI